MIVKDFSENMDGVHLMNGEHAVCGDAWDIGSEPDAEDMSRTRKRTITCERCINMILLCRGVRIARD